MTNQPGTEPYADLGGNPEPPIDPTPVGSPAAPVAGTAPAAPAAGSDPDVIGAGAPGSAGPVKDPEDWVTGDQPMTDAQRGYLDTLAKRAGETLPADLTKAEASEQIDRLQGQTGAGPTGR